MQVRATVLLVTVVIIIWAAIIGITASVQPLNKTHLAAATIVAAAVAIQRISGVQAWLSRPKNSRKDRIEVIAQQTLINLCSGRVVSNELLELSVHVWEVPLWYRRIFPYNLRCWLRRMLRKSRESTTYTLRPKLHRTAALGLLKRPPSGIRFQKGVGLVGMCIVANDRSEYVTLNVSEPEYASALESASEEEWRAHDTKLTNSLPLADAIRLSRLYGQVIGKIVQNTPTGEAIGCVTVSVKTSDTTIFDFEADKIFRDKLTDLAQMLAVELAS
jgi:hypothetical protein